MKKTLAVVFLVIAFAYYLNSDDEIQQQEESVGTPDLPTVAKTHENVNAHQVKVLTKTLPKQVVTSPHFKSLTSVKEEIISNQDFLKTTFESLIQCYEEGCGEEADHQGYFNKSQTVAMLTINRVLRSGLQSDTSPQWLKEQDLLNLFSSENANTRKLSFEHLMRRGDKEVQINKILDHSENLDGYSAGDTFKQLVKHTDQSNTDLIIDAAIKIMNDPEKDDLAKDEVLEAFTKTKLTENQAKRIADANCAKLEDINNKDSANYLIGKIGESAGIQLKLEEHCK